MFGRDILVEALEREEVEVIFAYPGGASMEIHQSHHEIQNPNHSPAPMNSGGSFAAERVCARDRQSRRLHGPPAARARPIS